MRITVDDRKIIVIAVLVAAFFLRQPLVASLIPFLIALALAAVIEPVSNYLHTRLRLPKSASALISLLMVVLAGGYLFLIVSTKVLSELVRMGSRLQRYQTIPVDLASDVIVWLNELNELFDQRGLPAAAQENILQTVDNLTQTAVGWVTQAINLVLNAASQVPALILVLVIALIATYFLVKDREMLVNSVIQVFPKDMRERIRDAQQRVVVDLVGFFKAQILLTALSTIIVAIGLIAIGIDYWMTLSLIAGVLDFIPVVGPGFLFVPWAIGAAALGETVLALFLIIIYLIQFVARQIFQATLLGDSIGVHPLVMLAAIYAGIHFFGLYAIIVAPVIVIMVKTAYYFTVSQKA